MKLDMDLARNIMLAIEAKPESELGDWTKLAFDGHTRTAISYHIKLLHEDGLVHGVDCSDLDNATQWEVTELTWKGHEFLDHSRIQSTWEKAKSIAATKADGLSVAVVGRVLGELAMKAIG